MGVPLLIVGASARAAAFSAIRAGLRPTAIDLFADRDLAALCPVRPVPAGRYPAALPALARDAPPGPWLYTGGLENRPAIVEQISCDRMLWGNDSACLRRVRGPFALSAAWNAADVPCPAIRAIGERPNGRWLVKPFAGSGGTGIQHADNRSIRRPSFFQEFIDGESQSGVFVADDAGCRLLGVTRQLVGADWLHAAAFRYSGSIGPLTLTPTESIAWERLGAAVTTFGRLRGLFGVDAIVRDGVPWPVDVNPRYTASAEVIEYATGIRAMACHRQAFDQTVRARSVSDGFCDTPSLTLRTRTEVIGKAIWYAPRCVIFPDDGPWRSVLRHPSADEPPAYADIPAAGARIAAGRPVLTFFAVAASTAECERELRWTAADIDGLVR